MSEIMRAKGLIPRDFSKVPHGSMAHAPAFDLPLIPRSEWADRCAQKDADKSWLSDIRDTGDAGKPIPSLDQDGRGDCWAFSSTSAVTLLRAQMGEPYIPLCGTAVAYIIRPRSEGGNGIESTEWMAENGVPSQALWPQGETGRNLDTPEMRADAAKRKIQKWLDLDPQNMEEEMATCLLCNIPVVFDSDPWGHSISATRFRVRKGRDGIYEIEDTMIWNSWANGYGNNGMAWIKAAEGYNPIPNGAVAPNVTMGST